MFLEEKVDLGVFSGEETQANNAIESNARFLVVSPKNTRAGSFLAFTSIPTCFHWFCK